MATSFLRASGARMVNPRCSNLSHLRRSQLRSCLLVLSREVPISWLMSRWVTFSLCDGSGEELVKIEQRLCEARFQFQKYDVFELLAGASQASAQDLQHTQGKFGIPFQ